MKKGRPFSLATAIMKISIIPVLIVLSTFCTLAKNSNAQAVLEHEISIRLSDQSLKSAISRIGQLSGAKFSYSPELIKSVNKITFDFKDEKLSVVLDRLAKASNLKYYCLNGYIVLTRAGMSDDLVPENQLPARSISGTVLDDKSQPLPGVTVMLKGTNTGTSTDNNGKFQITVPDENAILVFKMVGYGLQEIAVANKETMKVLLLADAQKLNEVVIVAYGNTTQRTATGALQTVNAKELQDIPAAQFTQKLQGKLAGVQINQANGRPGQGMFVTIRGSASISTGASPLYVVDGFPIVGDISNINPDEIENITVLKDAASTALYGSRAAFGVVVVTTKQAKKDQTIIGVNAYTGFQQVPQKGRPEVMNGQEYAQFRKEYYQDLGQPIPAAYQNPSQYGEGFDWYDAMLRSAPISNYSVSVASSKDKFSSSVTAGYFEQKGVVLNSFYKRFSLRANTLYNISDKIRLGANIAPEYNFDNTPVSDGIFDTGGLLFNAVLTAPIIPYQNPDGSLPTQVTTPGISAFTTPNWVRSIQDIKNESNVSRLLANTFLEVEPIQGLLLKTSINVDLGSTRNVYFQPSTANRTFGSVPSALNANLSVNDSKYYSWLSETTAGYKKSFGDHNFDVLAGYTVQRFRSDASNISGSNFPDDRIQTINAALVKNNATMDIQEWSLLSYLARLNYSFKDKYLVGASIRRDGSSRFGTDNKWGNFPAVSAAWIASEEDFLKSFQALSFLKVRASYGLIGNNNIGNYTQYATVASGVNVPFNNTTFSGIAVTNLGNSSLGWEKTSEFDLGLDIGFLSNRIYLSYDYYNKITSNLLYSLAVPQESGFGTFTGNVGKVKFWGHEFSVNTNNLIGKFKWNTNFNIAYSSNRVLALSGVSDQLIAGSRSVRTITKVGGKIGQFYGLVQDGVYRDQADYDNSPKNNNSQVGTIKFKDLNGDGVIKYGDTDGDKTIIGDPFPDFTFGITNTFSYKNFDLSIVASGALGGDIAAMTEQGTTNLDGVFNVLKDVQNRWRSPQDPGDGKYGKNTGATGDERDQFHSRFIQDGSYFTIKNITLGYAVPLKNTNIFKSVRLFASLQQAFVFTGYSGANPEISSNGSGSLTRGVDFSAYPVPRTYSFGLNVNLK